MFYTLGGGFTFEFEKLRLRRETLYVCLLIGIALVASVWLLYNRSSSTDVIYVSIALIFFTYFAIKKEKERD
ncbi:hypothetical protein GCM10010912_16860 [Paenibacillus albidus]|uniref:Uncharacterized protein n=2 Tax=Paenibacillus albidus TaxID=2041023 RepID=A0A917FD86_9BACL|nr:hypothetical protein GCM10010912_16860 [Paenibacillus albidus]